MNLFKNTFFRKNNLNDKYLNIFLKPFYSSKKGITTTVFSWVFMTIIGGVLMISIYSILNTYWTIEQENNNLEFAKALTNTLNVRAQSLSVSSATVFNTIPLMGNKDANLQCIGGEFTRLSIDGRELIYEPLNEYLDIYPFIMPPINNELPQNIYLILENFNFPMSISPMIAVVPKSHIIIINQSNGPTYSLFQGILNTRRSYQQLSFITWDLENGLTESEMRTQIDTLNPSSVVFLDFNENFIEEYINTQFSRERIPVYHIKSNFQKMPSTIDLTNTGRIVEGSFSYTYSNHQSDYLITNQLNEDEPKIFRFYDTNDEITIFMFSLFSTPSNFECAYNSLIQRSEFVYELSKNKIEIILQDPISTNETYCQSFLPSSSINNFYQSIYFSIDQLYTNRTHNLFTTSMSSPYLIIDSIDNNQLNLNSHSCQLIY
ncbi:MAG: hypothetical protein LAT82_01905 [Nanoarchaeota archaeon]|nr:hypothetical protein [Nanoarchaeota archaeon]